MSTTVVNQFLEPDRILEACFPSVVGRPGIALTTGIGPFPHWGKIKTMKKLALEN